MLKEGSLNFSDLKKKLKEKGGEILYPENEFLRLEVSPAEAVRYEENSKMAEVVFEEFEALIDGKIDLGSIKKRSDELMEKLNPKQRDLLRNITETIINGGGVLLEGIPFSCKADTLQDKYRKNGKLQAYEYFCAGVSERVYKKINYNDVKLTPWGAVVVIVKDEDAWREIYDPSNEMDVDNQVVAQGFIRRNNFTRGQVNQSVEEYPYINAQFKRTVFVRADNINNKQAEEVEKHELFHELYNNVLTKHQKIEYRGQSDRLIFEGMKNEAIAYLFSQSWQYRLDWLASFLRAEGNLNKSIDHNLVCLHKYIVSNRLKEKLQHDNPEKFQFIATITDKDIESVPDDVEDRVKNEAFLFFKEIVYFMREIIRLKYLKSDNFDEAIKALLTAQSFKEMRYKLSKLEKDTPLEPSSRVDLENLDQKGNLNRALHFLNNSMRFRLSVKHIDSLIDALKRRKEEIKNSTSEIDKKHAKRIDEGLEHFERDGERIIKLTT